MRMRFSDLRYMRFDLQRHVRYVFAKPYGLLLAFFLLSFTSFSQVNSTIDSTLIRIGEELKYTIEVEADSTDVVLFPEGPTFNPLEVIESYKIDTTYQQAKIRLIKRYGLTQFDSGSYTIPRQQIHINNKPFL